MPESSEMDEIHRRTSGALTATVSAAALVAETLFAAVAAHLRRTAERDRERARQERARVAAMRNTDAGIWRGATRRSWWRTATAEDISRAWRAVSMWHFVDPDAARARRIMVDRLAERGVTVEAAARMDAGDVQWLRTALELHGRRVQAEERPETGADRSESGHAPSREPEREPEPGQIDHTDNDRERMAERVRGRWSPERAALVLESEAWPAFAYRLHQHEALGGDLDAMLDGIDLQGARNPAALAEWQTENANLALIEREQQRRAAADQHEPTPVGERQPIDQDPARLAAYAWFSERANEEARRAQYESDYGDDFSDVTRLRGMRDETLAARDRVATAPDPAEAIEREAYRLESVTGGRPNADSDALRALVDENDRSEEPQTVLGQAQLVDQDPARVAAVEWMSERATRRGDLAAASQQAEDRDGAARAFADRDELLAGRDRIAAAADPESAAWREAADLRTDEAEALRSIVTPPGDETEREAALEAIDQRLAYLNDREPVWWEQERHEERKVAVQEMRERIAGAENGPEQVWRETRDPDLYARTGMSAGELRRLPAAPPARVEEEARDGGATHEPDRPAERLGDAVLAAAQARPGQAEPQQPAAPQPTDPSEIGDAEAPSAAELVAEAYPADTRTAVNRAGRERRGNARADRGKASRRRRTQQQRSPERDR